MRLSILLILITLGLGSFAQSFQLDPTFQPSFDIRNQRSAYMGSLVELPSGNIIFAGAFDIALSNPGQLQRDIGSTTRNGSRNFNFAGTGGGSGIVDFYNDSVLINGSNAYGFIDTNGFQWNYPWQLNYGKTVKCRTGGFYVYKDGSILFGNSSFNNGLPCHIINPPDTFPGRHIVKVNPLGLWDSTFIGIANAPPRGFLPYDSNRLLVYGKPFELTHYNGVQVDGLFRIYLDGTLDTTFSSPLSSVIAFNYFMPGLVEVNGKILLTGSYLLKGQTQHQTLVRLNPNGSLDTTFMNFSGPTDTNNQISNTEPIAPTADGGYLVGGIFNNYQGYSKRGIAKIDSSGKVEPQYFTGLGPDSSNAIGAGYPMIVFIKKSKFGGYYVGGDFTKWDGLPSQPLVRLTDLVIGLDENGLRTEPRNEVSVYPNPTTGIFSVKSKEKIKNIEVFGVEGKLIQSFVDFTSTSLSMNFSARPDKTNLGGLSSGIYFLRIELQNGEVISKKIIKQ